MENGLKAKVYTGVQWTTLSTVVTAVVQMVRLAILARFLEKSDFGLVAIITFVFGMIEMIGDLGFSTAIMHKKNLSKNEFASLYWIQLIVFSILYLFLFLVSKPIASFYNEPRISSLLPISLLGLFFLGIGKLYDTVFQKEFQFRTIAVRNIVSSLLSCVLAVIIAANGGGVYSLIISLLAQHAFFNLWNFIVGQRIIRIKFYLSFREVIGLVKIGLYQTGTQLLNYFSTQLDVLIIGKLLGMDVLGVYQLARDLLMKFTSVINSVANRVALPLFSSIQDNIESLRNNYSRMLNLLTTVNYPIIAAIGALSIPITTILYGEKFADTSTIIAIFTSITLLGVVSNPSGLITTAKGRTDLSFKCMIVRLLITIPILIVSAKLGYYPFLAGKVVMEIVLLLIVWYFMIWKVIQLPLIDYLATFLKRFTISAIVSCGCFFLIKELFVSKSIAVQLIIGTVVFVSMYSLFTWLFIRKDVSMLKSLINNVLQRLRR